jgi:GTP-binding protein YchF
MKVGIVGFPGAGKTTIFNALTGLAAETGLGGKVRENTGVIKVPDERVALLAELHHSKKQVLAEIVFVDVAAPPDAQQRGGGLPLQVLQAMQGCEALVLVLRGFPNPMLEAPPHPVRELADFRAELILSDLGPLENRRERIRKEAGKERERALMEKCIAHIESEQPIAALALDTAEQQQLSGFGLLTAKPLLCLLNQDEADFPNGIPQPLAEAAAAQGLELMGISGKLEMDIAELPPEEQGEFLAAMGIAASARDRFVQRAYAMLELISFLTTGEDESRAWPIRRGTTALRAAGKVHSDIERGFIRAETIPYDDLIALGSEKKAREAGKMRSEGKEYVVRDGDVITFRFNV